MSENLPLVSICVPIYGVEKFIARCAISLFEQTYQNLEFVFVNDCTPDNSMVILKNTIAQYTDKKLSIKIIDHRENLGLGTARNTAISNASGEFVFHVDSDDYIDNNTISELVNNQQKTGSDIVSCFALAYRKTGVTREKVESYADKEVLISSLLIGKEPHFIWGRLIRKSLYLANSVKVERNADMSEDYQVIPRLMFYAQSVTIVDSYLYHVDHTNEKSYTNTFSKKHFFQESSSFEVLFDFFKGNALYEDSLKQAKADFLLRSYLACSRTGDDEVLLFQIKKQIFMYDKKYETNWPLPKVLALHISNVSILSIYVKTSVACDHFLRRIYSDIKRVLK